MSRTFPLLIGVATIGLNSLLLSPILSDVAGDFGASTENVALATTAYNTATAISALFLSRGIDRFGARASLCFSFALLATGAGLSFGAISVLMLIFGQALCGLGVGVALPAIYLLAATTAAPGQEAQSIGRVISGWSVAMVAGVPLASLITGLSGWRLCYAIITILAAAFAVFYLGQKTQRSDRPSVATPRSNLLAPFFIPGAAVLFFLNFLFMAAFYGVYTFLGTSLRHDYHLSLFMAGLAVLFYGMGFGLASFFDPIIRKLGVRRAMIICFGILVGVNLALGFSWANAMPVFIASLLWGFFNHFGLNMIIMQLNSLRSPIQGQVMGMNSVMSYSGGAAGTFIAGQLMSGGNFNKVTIAASVAIVMCCALSAIGRNADNA